MTENMGNLMYSLGAEWEDGSLEAIEDGLSTVADGFMTIIGTLFASAGAGFAVVQQFASINDELGKMAKNRGVAVETLQSLEYSFQSAGLEASEASNVLQNTQKIMADFNNGDADYLSLSKLGLNPNAYKDNEDFFMAIVDRLKGVEDEFERANLADALLGSRDLESLIEGGSDAIRQQRQELEDLGVLISNQDYEASAKFNDLLLKTLTILKGLGNKLATSFLPLFSDLLDSFNNWLKVNKELITTDLKAFIEGIIAVFRFFVDLIMRVVEHLGGLKVVLAGVAIAFALWQLPLIATVGAIVAVLAIFDDLMNFIKGNDSVIGSWVDAGLVKFEEFKQAFPVLGAFVQAQFDIIASIFDYFKNYIFKVWDLITGKISFTDFLEGQADAVLALLNQIADSFLSVFDSIFDSLQDKMSNIPFFDKIASMFGDSTVNVVQPATVVQSVPTATGHQNITNNYAISAQVDATNKSTAEALTEIKTSSYR